jgi:two-component system response regulator MprA
VVAADPVLRSLLQTVIEDAGIEVEVAVSGEVALRFVAAAEPSLVVLDLPVVPFSAGALVQRLEGISPGIPLVVLTDPADGGDERLLHRDAVSILPKPVQRQEVLTLVRTTLDRVAEG